MAAKTVEKLKRELDCAVCMNTLKNPRSLSCMHSFCEECLKQCDKASEIGTGELKCPMCRKVTTLSGEGVAGLKSNPLICRVLEVLEAKKSSSHIMCDACGDSESPLTTYCRDCLHFICDSCATSHAKMKLLMKNHCTVPLDKIDNGTIKIKWTEEGLWRKAYECEEHSGEPRRFYCWTCRRRVCRDCIVLDHTRPDHDCTTVQKMCQEVQEKVKDLSKSCMKKEVKVGSMLHDVEVKETEANRKFQVMKESIRDFKATAVANLNKEEEELLQQVQKFEGKFNHKIQAFRDKMEETKENLTRVQSRAKDVISTKEDADITKVPFYPEDVLKELEELIASDVTLTISMDVMALKGTMVREGLKLSEQAAPFAKFSLPHSWRETQKFLNPDKDIVNIFCDGTSVYVACKKRIYKKRMSCNVDSSPWLKLRHDDANDKQVLDMAISMKDKIICFIADTNATCTQLSKFKLDDFPTSNNLSSTIFTVPPCPLDSLAKITVDSKSRIVVANNKLSIFQDVLIPESVSKRKGKPPAFSAAKAPPGRTGTARTPATTVRGGFTFGVQTTPQVQKQQAFTPTFGCPTSPQQQPQQQRQQCQTPPNQFRFGTPHQQQPPLILGAQTSQQHDIGTARRSQTASAFSFQFSPVKTENVPSPPSSKANKVKTECTTLGSSIFKTSTTIYRGKPERISTQASSMHSGGQNFCQFIAGNNFPATKKESKLSSDSFKVPFDRVRSLAAAKSGQLVFLRGDKTSVVITDEDGRIQHEINEPGRMYLSISCTESDDLFVLSAIWGSHTVTLTKHSLEDGSLLEYVIYELDVSDSFQSDEWPVIGNHENDLVIMNTGKEIRVYSAEDWDILDDDQSDDCKEEDEDDVDKDVDGGDK